MTDHPNNQHRHSRPDLSRRQFAGAGVAAAGLFVASRGLAKDLAPTAESPMGPFYPLVHPADSDADMVWLKGHKQRAHGDVIEVSGRVLDLHGNPISGARLEIWQANSVGRYAHAGDISKAALDPNFQGYASIVCDRRGNWRIKTVKPSGYDSPIGTRPPHIHFDVRGRTHRNVAQLYFPEDADANAKDLLYRELGADAASSVAARDAASPARYRWDIVLMG